MRRELEIGARAWCRPFPAAVGALVLAAALSGSMDALSAYSATASYLLALTGSALGLWVARGIERAAWSRPAPQIDRLLVAAALGAALLALLVFHVARGAPANSSFGIGSLLGCVQLAALALVARRAPVAPAPRVVLFLIAATVVPALLPILRPLLDVSPSFHAGHFPGWIAALAPILTLTLIASALTSTSRAAATGNSPA